MKHANNRNRRIAFMSLALIATLPLAACGDKPEEASEDEMDAALLGSGEDPAVAGALEEQIMVDPDMVDTSNYNAVMGEGDDGSVPSSKPAKGAADASEKAALADIGGKGLMQAPAPKSVKGSEDTVGSTLGSRAEAQRTGKLKVNCASRLSYKMNWASQMPETFKVYPKANVKEAAGVKDADCNMRVVNFTTSAQMKSVVDYYYTKARRAGYSAEYQIRDGQHVLGGVKGDSAYVVFLKPSSGGTEVDIVSEM